MNQHVNNVTYIGWVLEVSRDCNQQLSRYNAETSFLSCTCYLRLNVIGGVASKKICKYVTACLSFIFENEGLKITT